MSGEFDLIARIRARADAAARDDVRIGIGDDAAIVRLPPGCDLVVSTDTLNAGVHFPHDTAAFDIGWKALAVNLSDLAAMGAQPAWCTLNLTLPQAETTWLDAFLDGFFALATRHGVALIGGDTTRGPLAITVTAHGFVPHEEALRRDGARVGDDVWVSGTLGDAAAGLARATSFSLRDKVPTAKAGCRSERRSWPIGHDAGAPCKADAGKELDGSGDDVPSPGAPRHPLPAEDGQQMLSLSNPAPIGRGVGLRGRTCATLTPSDALCERLNRPTPRVELGLALRGIAHAGIDVSDGLLADLKHVLEASGAGAELDPAALPTSPALLAAYDESTRQRLQLGGGDDYELCFTAPLSRADDVRAAAARAGVAVTCIGHIVDECGLRLRDRDGALVAAPALGYRHFSGADEGEHDPGEGEKDAS